MKEIVEQKLKEEEQAHLRIEKARQEADQLLQVSRRQAQQILDEAVDEAQNVAVRLRQQAEKEVAAEKAAVLAATREQVADALKRKEGAIAGLAAGILRRVITIQP